MTGRRLLVLAALVAAVAGVLAATGALAFLRAEQRRLARARRSARGETELRIVNPAGAAVSLQSAGRTLDEAAPLDIAAKEVWLPEGRYFVEASASGWRLLFPVSIDGTGQGPEPDGTWTVTVRPPASDTPPQLVAGAPGFAFVPGGNVTLGERAEPGPAALPSGFRPSTWVSSR